MKPRISGGRRTTTAARLLRVLSDGQWHATKELAKKVGHTFAQAKFRLIRAGRSMIERERHPTDPHQRQYRLTERRRSNTGAR